MSRRYTDTDKWKDEWYVSLTNDYRIIWQYFLDNCNHAGIAKQGVAIMNMFCRSEITEEELLDVFRDRIIKINHIYFLPKFIKYQYPSGLNSFKPAIVSVVKELYEHELIELVNELYGDSYVMIAESFQNHCQMIKRQDNKNKDDELKPLKTDDNNEIRKEIIEHLNLIAKKKYRTNSDATKRVLNARLNDGFKLEDFKAVINKKVAEWGTNPKMEQYLRPETLFGNKFESYLNQNGGMNANKNGNRGGERVDIFAEDFSDIK